MNLRNRQSSVLVILMGLAMISIAAAQRPFGTGTTAAPGVPTVGTPVGLTVPARLVGQADPLLAEYQKMENQVHSLVREYHTQKSDKRRAEIRKQLQELTEKQFEMRLDTRKEELDQLKQQMNAVAQKVKRREELRDQIVTRRVADLTKEDAELLWDPFRPSSFFAPIHVPSQQGLYPKAAGALSAFAPQYSQNTQNPWTPSKVRRNTVTSGTNSFLADKTARSPSAVFSESISRSSEMTVAEAQTRLEIAERDLRRVAAQHAAGGIGQEKLAKAEGDLALAKLAYQQARHHLDTRRELLGIEIDQATLEVEAISQQLSRLEKLYRSNAISESEVRNAQVAKQRAELSLKKQEAMLEALEFDGQLTPSPKSTGR